MRCVWLIAYERADADGRVGDLRRLQRRSTSANGAELLVNYWLGEDEACGPTRPTSNTRRCCSLQRLVATVTTVCPYGQRRT